MTLQGVHDVKEAREDAVVLSFLAHLRIRGLAAALVEQPDRLTEDVRTFAAVTSDALFAVDRRAQRLVLSHSRRDWWACDVMALAAPFSHSQIPETLHDALNPLAAQQAIVITITGEIRDIKHAETTVAVLRSAVTSEPSGSLDLGGATATWTPVSNGSTGTREFVLLQPAPSANLAEQMTATMREPLRSKIEKQAQHARQAGCSAVVLLDWSGHDKIKQGTHWLAKSPGTIKAAIEPILDEAQGDLDAVFVLDRDGAWHLIYGAPFD